MRAICDLETTGIRVDEGHDITEIAVLLLDDTWHEGEFYQSFNEPSKPITAEITGLTGITPEMVAGHTIDWNRVNLLLSQADIVIAHHAPFERSYLDPKNLDVQKWGCSKSMVAWGDYGLTCTKQRHLIFEMGGKPESHRALTDCRDLLWLLRQCPQNRLHQHPPSDSYRTFGEELLERSKEAYYLCTAVGAPFESKDYLASNGFRWQKPIPIKAWQRIHSHTEGGAVRDIITQAKCLKTATWKKIDITSPEFSNR